MNGAGRNRRESGGTHQFRILAIAGVIGFIAGCHTDGNPAADSRRSYPTTRQTNVVDDYHGIKVADPYRWLEDDNSAETRSWVEAQNKLTFDYLRNIPEFDPIKIRLTRLWNYERFGVPFRQGGR